MTPATTEPGIAFVPFVPGRRATDEADHPSLGSSDRVAVLTDSVGDDDNVAYLLFSAAGIQTDNCALDATLSFCGPDGTDAPSPVPGWSRRPLAPKTFVSGGGPAPPALRELSPACTPAARLVLAVAPQRDLVPGAAWGWADVAPGLRAGATDAQDPFSFGHRFTQRVQIDLRLTEGGVAVGSARAALDVCDLRRCGSLYARITEGLIAPDTERQARAAGVPDPGHAYHPWFPVLRIGPRKGELYGRALVGDIVHKRHNLTDPGWLVRIGVFLELLTCVGIAEAVKQDVGDLLTPAERHALDHTDAFAEIRARVDVDAWRAVWELREIAFARRRALRTGPVSATNLLRKRRATLEFLRVHHEDLKHAIELAGPNHHNAQETWQRVFRDAERAVLSVTPDAFPELEHLPRETRDFVLWHRRGHVGIARCLHVPPAFGRLLGDRDGLFASACNQYRASLNDVASWARARGLMDHTGEECVPRQVSLLEAHLNQPARVALLQGCDGYAGGALEVGAEMVEAFEPPAGQLRRLIEQIDLFAMLDAPELDALASTARPLTLAPTERVVLQGQPGTSLFIVVEGAVEVIVRRDGAGDVTVDTMGPGAVVGEMSLLTGAPRNATVRAVDGALLFEIGREQYEPVLRGRPELVDALARTMQERLRARRALLQDYDSRHERAVIRERIRRLFFTGAAD